MNRLGRVGIAVALLAGALWAGGVAEANHLPSSVVVCVDASSGVVSRMTSDSKCVGATQFWSASKPAPLLCWNPSLLARLGKTRVVSIAPSSGCAKQLRSVPANTMSLVCANGETGVLRVPLTGQCAVGNKQTWVRPTSRRNVATTTTLISSTASTTSTTSTASTTSTTAVVVPSVSLLATTIQGNTWPKAVTVTANVPGTIYLAEGDFVVRTVADITSAPSLRWAQGTVTSANTPTSIAIDVDALTNGYYRVFIANSQGVLSAPATNNVTISVTRASTATTVVALTCATGGSCTVGVDRGAGGGIVFYYSATAFTSTGSDCGTNCHYLEAAPTDIPTIGITSIEWATTAAVCYARGSTSGTSNCQSNSIYSGDFATQSASRTAATAIGKGMANTNQIYARLTTAGGVTTTNYAAGLAWEYTNNSKSDWFLPSKDELIQLWANKSGLNMNGFTYWSSSEYDYMFDSFVWATGMMMLSGYSKNGSWNVRPVRAG